uniref:Vesicle associated membrane protein 5 n=1 Tax=Pelodiscus sinensis TaxID=13735 RepID=K7G0Z4_PELSI
QVEKKLERCQKDAEEVTQIMLDNYSKVLDREVKLSDLDNRADELRVMSSTFSKTTKVVAQKQRWANRKWKLILAGGARGAVLVIVLVLAVMLAPGGAGTQAA